MKALILSFCLICNANFIEADFKPLTSWEIRREKMSDDQRETIDRFLEKISQIESSGGKNFDHAEIQHGMHKGHRAIGSYGLMPNTVREVINRMRMEGTINPQIQSLRDLPPDRLKKELEANPLHQRELAEFLANRVLEKQQGDQQKAAYAWEQGHNLKPEQIEKRNYREADYVKKFIQLQNMLNQKGGMANE